MTKYFCDMCKGEMVYNSPRLTLLTSSGSHWISADLCEPCGLRIVKLFDGSGS